MNSFDGAWRLFFEDADEGDGIVILRSGKLLGCDARYFFEGDYSISHSGQMTAKIRVKHYAGERGSIFQRGDLIPLTDFLIELRGQLEGNRFRLIGSGVNSDHQFGIVLTPLTLPLTSL